MALYSFVGVRGVALFSNSCLVSLWRIATVAVQSEKCWDNCGLCGDGGSVARRTFGG